MAQISSREWCRIRVSLHATHEWGFNHDLLLHWEKVTFCNLFILFGYSHELRHSVGEKPTVVVNHSIFGSVESRTFPSKLDNGVQVFRSNSDVMFHASRCGCLDSNSICCFWTSRWRAGRHSTGFLASRILEFIPAIYAFNGKTEMNAIDEEDYLVGHGCFYFVLKYIIINYSWFADTRYY